MPARDFDEQAASFDRRAGLPPAAAEEIARAVSRLGAMRASDRLLEIGAGTGQIGVHLCALPGRYIGFDRSSAMLDLFARAVRAEGRSATLMESDAEDRWPADDHSIKVFFASRVLHLLRPDHVVAEIWRGARADGATLLIGRVQRSPESLRSLLRREMRERLWKAGFPPDQGREAENRILEACRARGAIAVESMVAAHWTAKDCAERILRAWSNKNGLAGLELPAAVKSAILRGLESWSAENFGPLATMHEAEEKYCLEGVRLRPD